MKLLNCLKCHDIFALSNLTRVCPCGLSKGRYLGNGLTALVTGEHTRVLGMLNQEYVASIKTPIIPFHTYYKWFPILPERKHNVIHVKAHAYDTYVDSPVVSPPVASPPATATSSSIVHSESVSAPPQMKHRHRAKCLNCECVIESHHRHDFVSCSCGKLSLDGGGCEFYNQRTLYEDKFPRILLMPTDDAAENEKATQQMLSQIPR